MIPPAMTIPRTVSQSLSDAWAAGATNPSESSNSRMVEINFDM